LGLATVPPLPAQTEDAPDFVPGEILVKYRPSLRGALSEARETLGNPSLERFGEISARALRAGRGERGRWVKLVSEGLRDDKTGTRELLEELRRVPSVDYAELNVYVTAQYFPNDPYYASSGAWGQDFRDLWGLQSIAAEMAWDVARGDGVVVAVIDTGIDDEHEDLAANVFRNAGELGLDNFGLDRATNGLDDDGNGFIDDWRGWNFVAWTNDPTDDHGHGTHVAGTIAAVADNGLGIIGVAPRARVLAVKALDQYGYGTIEQVNDAIRYAADSGAAVVNLSLGAFGKTPQSLVDAVDYAHDVKEVVVIAAAGNSGTDVGRPDEGFFPANLRDAIAVSAFDHHDLKASFSNGGAKIDVAAPGGGGTEPSGSYDPYRSVLSLRASQASSSMTGSELLTVGGSYLRQAGTSMAAPHASGVAALVKSLRPAASPEAVRQHLRAGSDDVGFPGFDADSGYGRLNATRALLENPLVAHLTHPDVPASASQTVQVRGSAGGPGFLRYRLEWGQGPWPVSWQPIVSSTAPVTNGILAQWSLANVDDGTHVLRLVSISTSGREYEDRMAVVVDSLAITEPAPEAIPLVGAGQPISIRGTVEPANFVRYTMRAQGRRTGAVASSRFLLAGGGLSKVSSGLLATFDPTGLPADHYTITVAVELFPSGTVSEATRVIYDPRLHPGWPVGLRDIGSGPFSYSLLDHLTAADVNLDGRTELLIAYGQDVHLLDGEGLELPGWPQTLAVGGTNFQNGAAAGDLTGDGVPEIVAATYHGDLHVWSADGVLLSGWPRRSSGSRFVAIDDIDGDGTSEIVTTGANYVDVLEVDGQHLPGFPLFVGSTNPAATGDLNGDGSVELVVASSYAPGWVLSISSRGSVLPGWPRDINPGAPANVQIHAYPVLGDLDGDGDLEIVVNGYSGQVFAFHHDGTDVDGWPQATEPVTVNPPAIGDLDGDGLPEVIAGASTVQRPTGSLNYLYAWHGNGAPVAGWPAQHPEWLSFTFFGFGSPIVADIEGEGLADVLAASDSFYRYEYALNGLHPDGSRLPDFPRPTKSIGASATGTAAIADFDGDGLVEMAWVDYEKRVYLWDFDAPISASLPWPMYRGDSGHRGRLAGPDFASIEGRVADRSGRGVPGVLVSATGTVSREALTDGNGEYALTRLVRGGDYTLTPSLSGVTFTPPSATFPSLSAGARQDFLAEESEDVVILSLTVSGLENGQGTVFLDPPGRSCINFGAPVETCVETYARDTVVTATATPAPDSKFLGWGGACSGLELCQVTLTDEQTVTAAFLGPQELVVLLEGVEYGQGTVWVEPAGTLCDLFGAPNQSCSTFLPPDTPVTLTATPAPDSKFLGWGGACSGLELCQVTLTDEQTVTAAFLGPQELVVVLQGMKGGDGLVTVEPPGTSCVLSAGTPTEVCSVFLQPDTLVSLTAASGLDSIFLGWGGACGGTASCSVALADRTEVFANFALANRPPVAEAGVSRSIELGLLAVLDGTASSDPDGDPLSFLWTDSSGSVVGVEPVVSLGLALGAHRFTLTVSDPSGASSQDSVDISVVDTTPPMVDVMRPTGDPAPEGRPLGIEWIAADIGALSGFDVLFSSDGSSYTPVAECAGLPFDRRTCTWTSPGPASSQGVLRVVAVATGNRSADDVPLSILPVRSVSIPIAIRRDDGEENASGSVTLGDGDLDVSEKWVGLRYQNVAVPGGARVLSAEIEMTARSTRSAATALSIRGQAADDAPPLSTANRDLSSRTATSASTVWNPGAWMVGSTYRTPDITAIVQEIVNRPGWQSGRALLIVLSRGTGKREASSFNHRPEEAPVLRLEYMDPAH
jgi:subtilisin family serine protease